MPILSFLLVTASIVLVSVLIFFAYVFDSDVALLNGQQQQVNTHALHPVCHKLVVCHLCTHPFVCSSARLLNTVHISSLLTRVVPSLSVSLCADLAQARYSWIRYVYSIVSYKHFYYNEELQVLQPIRW